MMRSVPWLGNYIRVYPPRISSECYSVISIYRNIFANICSHTDIFVYIRMGQGESDDLTLHWRCTDVALTLHWRLTDAVTFLNWRRSALDWRIPPHWRSVTFSHILGFHIYWRTHHCRAQPQRNTSPFYRDYVLVSHSPPRCLQRRGTWRCESYSSPIPPLFILLSRIGKVSCS
jgi:hypothetical protein